MRRDEFQNEEAYRKLRMMLETFWRVYAVPSPRLREPIEASREATISSMLDVLDTLYRLHNEEEIGKGGEDEVDSQLFASIAGAAWFLQLALYALQPAIRRLALDELGIDVAKGVEAALPYVPALLLRDVADAFVNLWEDICRETLPEALDRMVERMRQRIVTASGRTLKDVEQSPAFAPPPMAVVVPEDDGEEP